MLPEGTILFSLSIVVVIWVAALLAFRGLRSQVFSRMAVTFSAGLLLGVAFLHMMPEAFEELGAERAGLFVLIGYLSIFLVERFVMIHPCEEHGCDYHTLGVTAWIGFSLHSFLGGVALGSSLLVPGLAMAVFIATIVHKGPEAFSLTSLLILGNEKRAKVISLITLFSLMVPAGIFLAVWELPLFGGDVVGIAIALSAGTFLHLATGDLLPGSHSKTDGQWKGLVAFFFGIGFTLLTKWLEH